MASLGIALFSAAAFTGAQYLMHYLTGDSADERARHDHAIEAYQKESGEFQRQRAIVNDWLYRRAQEKHSAVRELNALDADMSTYFHEYNLQAAKDGWPKVNPKYATGAEPKLADFYKPSRNYAKAERWVLGGIGALSVGGAFVALHSYHSRKRAR